MDHFSNYIKNDKIVSDKYLIFFVTNRCIVKILIIISMKDIISIHIIYIKFDIQFCLWTNGRTYLGIQNYHGATIQLLTSNSYLRKLTRLIRCSIGGAFHEYIILQKKGKMYLKLQLRSSKDKESLNNLIFFFFGCSFAY